jgi:hypothetical protein
MSKWKHLVETDAQERAFIRSFDVTDIRHWEKFFRLAERTGKAAVYYFTGTHRSSRRFLFHITNVDVPSTRITVFDPVDHTEGTQRLNSWLYYWRKNRLSEEPLVNIRFATLKEVEPEE